MSKKRILIFYATAGLGHRRSAQAIQETLEEELNHSAEIESLDIFDFAPQSLKRIFDRGYETISAKFPYLWKFLYQYADRKTIRKGELLRFIAKFSHQKWRKYIEQFCPDAIISTHPFSAHFLLSVVPSIARSSLFLQVITDYQSHAFWENEIVDVYFVADTQVKQQLLDRGIESKKIFVSGIPISEKFWKRYSRHRILKELHFRPDLPTALFIGGRLRVHDLSAIIDAVLQKIPAQFLIICGRDRHLFQEAQKEEYNRRSSVALWGYVENIEEIMAAADVAVTKAGGLTVTECLAQKLPMILYRNIPGQEEANARFLTQKGAAVTARSQRGVAQALCDFFEHPAKLLSAKLACVKIRRPHPARTIAKKLKTILFS